MKKKSKFVQVILTREEWNAIKSSMEIYESICENNYNHQIPSIQKVWRNTFKIVYHFNHIALANIEDLIEKADKERRKKSRDKSKQKES